MRLLQVDIAVRDERAGVTGWYFATYVYDRAVTLTSPWRKMVPLGLMWGNDPAGAPLVQSWINPAAPAYALAHLGVGGRLNGPVDNRASACMACHNTAQSPSLARILPQGACNVSPFKEAWFRNLSGSTAFGRFSNTGGSCVTTAVRRHRWRRTIRCRWRRPFHAACRANPTRSTRAPGTRRARPPKHVGDTDGDTDGGSAGDGST